VASALFDMPLVLLLPGAVSRKAAVIVGNAPKKKNSFISIGPYLSPAFPGKWHQDPSNPLCWTHLLS
jgi:hypothetical protein